MMNVSHTANRTDSEQKADTLCIHEIVEAYAKHTPQHIAATDEQEAVTYQQLNEQANQLAHYLQRLGYRAQQPVAIIMEQSVRTVISMLAVLKAGGAYVPIDVRYPLDRVVTILQEAGITIVLTQENICSGLDQQEYATVDVKNDWPKIAQESSEHLAVTVTERDLAYIIFTSGTTGKPKGVEIEHRSLRNLIHWHQQAFHVTTEERATLFASIAFDASVWELWPYLCSGASVHVIPLEVQGSLAQLQQWIIEQKITICFLPTPLAEQVILLEWPASLSLRILLTGGDRLHFYPPASLPFTFVNNYGPTENTVVATSMVVKAQPDATELPSIGRPITNVELYILDETFQPVPEGDIGELYIAGASVARGYRNQPQLTQERFLPHPFVKDSDARIYKTGDLARWNADGTLSFLGRNDQQVKVRGFRIELSEIEVKLAAYPHLQESCVVAVLDTNEDTVLCAFYVPKTNASVSSEDLQAYLKSILPEYMVPATFVQLDTLPVTTSGKVDRQLLAKMSGVQAEPQETATLVTNNETEHHLVTIWSDILKGHQFTLHDDFFKIGGHSLSVLQLIVRIRETFGVSITVRDIFQAPTITQLAQTVQAKVAQKK